MSVSLWLVLLCVGLGVFVGCSCLVAFWPIAVVTVLMVCAADELWYFV